MEPITNPIDPSAVEAAFNTNLEARIRNIIRKFKSLPPIEQPLQAFRVIGEIEQLINGRDLLSAPAPSPYTQS